MKYFLLLILLPIFVSAADFSNFFIRTTLETDSLELNPSRKEVTVGLTLSGSSWRFDLLDTFLSTDSGGIVPRRNLGENDLLMSGRWKTGSFILYPELRMRNRTEDGLDLVLPGPQTGRMNSTLRPGMRITAELLQNLMLDVGGRYILGSFENSEEELDWNEIEGFGSVTWNTPTGPAISVGGVYHNSIFDDAGDYENDLSWKRIDIGISTGPGSLPAMTQIMGEIVYHIYYGENCFSSDIADRFTARVRAVKAIMPDVSMNMSLTSILDLDGDEFRYIGTGTSTRLTWHFWKDQQIPSSLSFGAQYTNTRFNTSRFETKGRFFISHGFCGIFRIDLRDGPTVSSIESNSRPRVVICPGIEYRYGKKLRVWASLENERTDLDGIKSWSRIRAGLEFAP